MIRAGIAVLTLVASAAVQAAVTPPIVISRQGLEIRLRPHAPSQMMAFYEARGFPVDVMPHLEKACFITVSIRNMRGDIVWLEPASWTLEDAGGKKVPLYTLERWTALWRRHRVSDAAQTAFRWTQLPGERDLHPEEPVGGNISFAPGIGPYRLTVRFRLGPNKAGGPLTVVIPGLTCPGRK